ncbi:MAG: class I SAM-dependent methyltransferase [Clostridiales bacterium]|nr:class I SAM-dependent methyltransferase [Clostridiales bacterium]
MKHIKHDFLWESEASQEIFWQYQDKNKAQSIEEAGQIITLCGIALSADPVAKPNAIPGAQPGADSGGSSAQCRILDVGCGLGYHIEAFARMGCSVTGIDVAEYSVSHAQKVNPSQRILKMQGKDIPWEEAFDLVIAIRHTLGFMSYDELTGHIARIWRSVKPGGCFILSVPYTLERAVLGLPVNQLSERDGIFYLTDKFLMEENIKVERFCVIDPAKDTIEEFNEKQRYYAWQEILDLLYSCGITDVASLKDFNGSPATDGEDARIFLMRKP